MYSAQLIAARAYITSTKLYVCLFCLVFIQLEIFTMPCSTWALLSLSICHLSFWRMSGLSRLFVADRKSKEDEAADKEDMAK